MWFYSLHPGPLRHEGGYSRDRSDSWGRGGTSTGLVPGIKTKPGVVRGESSSSSLSVPNKLVSVTSNGPHFESGMTEEQMALERARFEREELERKKREQEEAQRREELERQKRELRERERQEYERRLQETRERERLEYEQKVREAREKELLERERERERFRDNRYGDVSDGGRWERAAAVQREAPPRLYTVDGDYNRDRGYSFESAGSRGSHRDGDRERPQSNVSNAYPHHAAPTRILQNHNNQQQSQQPQQKRLFDSKSGNFIVQEEKDNVASRSTKTAPSKPSSQEKSSRDRKREVRTQELNAIAKEEQRKKEERAKILKEARAKERAERQPRTQGVLFRFVPESEAEELMMKEREESKSLITLVSAVRNIDGK